jgi:ABC-type uncharacterized transport system substrate-binding protein
MMDRRAFITVLGGSIFAVPLADAQQPARVPRIAFLSQRPVPSVFSEAFRQGLRDLGYTEGQNIVLELRGTDRYERLRQLAAELVDLRPDVFVVHGTAGTEAARTVTSIIPIVGVALFDPVEAGLVASLARPGGNITGLATHTGELMAKRVQILKEAIPAAVRAVVLRLPGSINDLMVRDIETAGRQLGLRLHVIEIRRAEDLPGAFQAAIRGGTQAVMTTQGPFFALNRVQIADLALKHRLPSFTGEPGAAEAGTLMFYGPHIWDGCQRAASYVDRILKGAKPGDLPVEQPTRIELVINGKTAKALGLTIPQSVLVRADHIIE